MNKGMSIVIAQNTGLGQEEDAEEEIRFLSRSFDVVIHEADADNLPWVKGIIDGLEDRAKDSLASSGGTLNGQLGEGKERRRTKPIFMYGGGTGNMCDDSRGEYLQEKVWGVSRVLAST